MNILVAGDFHSKIHENALLDAFTRLGHTAEKFAWSDYFKGYQLYGENRRRDSSIKSFYYRAQNKLLVGPTIRRINIDFLETCRQMRPDLVLIYRGTHILPAFLAKSKRYSGAIFSYNNDDPFSSHYRPYVWRHYVSGLRQYDHIFVYRQKNMEDLHGMGFSRCSLLRSYYIAALNYPMLEAPDTRYVCDVAFVGHFENDGRDEHLKSLIEAGLNVRIFGPEWQKSSLYQYFVQTIGPVEYAYDDYNLILNSSKIALVFLSKLNNDTYTRRCFEIPAAGTLMLSEYTRDLAGLFEEDVEAAYFRSREELVAKAKRFIADDTCRLSLAKAGRQRLLRDGHEVTDRARQILGVYAGLRH